jgi:hypothetical protein
MYLSIYMCIYILYIICWRLFFRGICSYIYKDEVSLLYIYIYIYIYILYKRYICMYVCMYVCMYIYIYRVHAGEAVGNFYAQTFTDALDVARHTVFAEPRMLRQVVQWNEAVSRRY